MPPSAMTGVLLFMRHLDGIHNGSELRHADTGNDSGGANRAWPDADLDRVGAGIDQRPGALAGRNIAGNHLHGVRQPFDPVDRFENALGMPMRRVHDDEIDAGLEQPFAALETRIADRSRGGDAQSALFILAGVRVGNGLFDILHRDQTDAAVVAVDHKKLFDTVLMQQPLGLFLAYIFPQP